MNEIMLGFFDELCERARKNPDDIGMACDLIAEMDLALKEIRPVKANYQPALEQFLALHDVLKAQEIEWQAVAWAQKGSPK